MVGKKQNKSALKMKHTSSYTLTLLLILLSCAHENEISRISELDEQIVEYHHFCFDSLQIQEEFVLRAFIDTVSKSDYFLVADYQGQKDTLRLPHLFSENCFPRMIWNGANWENVYHHPTMNRFYFTLNFFTEDKLAAIEVRDNKPEFIFQEEHLLTTYSAFIVSKNGFEVPIVRAENQGYSENVNFDFQKTGELVLTSKHSERIIKNAPY